MREEEVEASEEKAGGGGASTKDGVGRACEVEARG